MFDLKSFLQIALPTAAAILPLVLGLVTYAGSMGAKGKVQLGSSMGIGLLLGGATMYFQSPPTDPAGWFAIVLFGLIVGLGASGVYDTGKGLAAKVKAESIKDVQ